MKRARELSLPHGDDCVTVAFLDVTNLYPGYHDLACQYCFWILNFWLLVFLVLLLNSFHKITSKYQFMNFSISFLLHSSHRV